MLEFLLMFLPLINNRFNLQSFHLDCFFSNRYSVRIICSMFSNGFSWPFWCLWHSYQSIRKWLWFQKSRFFLGSFLSFWPQKVRKWILFWFSHFVCRCNLRICPRSTYFSPFTYVFCSLLLKIIKIKNQNHINILMNLQNCKLTNVIHL